MIASGFWLSFKDATRRDAKLIIRNHLFRNFVWSGKTFAIVCDWTVQKQRWGTFQQENHQITSQYDSMIKHTTSSSNIYIHRVVCISVTYSVNVHVFEWNSNLCGAKIIRDHFVLEWKSNLCGTKIIRITSFWSENPIFVAPKLSGNTSFWSGNPS